MLQITTLQESNSNKKLSLAYVIRKDLFLAKARLVRRYGESGSSTSYYFICMYVCMHVFGPLCQDSAALMAAHCSGSVFTVCVFTAVCLHFGVVKCRAHIPSMGHHTWSYVMSLCHFTISICEW